MAYNSRAWGRGGGPLAGIIFIIVLIVLYLVLTLSKPSAPKPESIPTSQNQIPPAATSSFSQ